MPIRRPISACALSVLALALACGCSSSAPPTGSASGRTTGASAGPTSSGPTTSDATGTAGPTEKASSAGPTLSGGPTQNRPLGPCSKNGAHAIADGTWSGPLTLNINGIGKDVRFTSTKGTGTLKLTVKGGKVTAGGWRLTWKSTGTARAHGASATLRLTGVLHGSANGTAAEPALPGSWGLGGTASVTEPEKKSVPIDESGALSPKVTIRISSCEAVVGTFETSFASKEARADFVGTAGWAGRRTG